MYWRIIRLVTNSCPERALNYLAYEVNKNYFGNINLINPPMIDYEEDHFSAVTMAKLRSNSLECRWISSSAIIAE